jgi:hypothetical protein
MFKQFSIGLQKLLDGQCASAREQKENIENLMLIPLIQGTLRYAYKTANEPYSEKAEAEGVVFAASVLPVVHACDAKAAKTIADNMVAGQNGTADWPAIKSAFESTYECMGVDPDMIGGLYDSALGEYMEGAAPMGMSTNGVSAYGSGAATDSSIASFSLATAAGLAYLFA